MRRSLRSLFRRRRSRRQHCFRRTSFWSVRARMKARRFPAARSLRDMRLLLLEEGHCFRDQALSFCKLQSSSPREILDASSLSTLVQMVSAGMGVTLIPEMAVPVETRSAIGLSRALRGSATVAHNRHDLAKDEPLGAAPPPAFGFGAAVRERHSENAGAERSSRPLQYAARWAGNRALASSPFHGIPQKTSWPTSNLNGWRNDLTRSKSSEMSILISRRKSSRSL